MSAVAAWSYTARATLWPRVSRDGWAHTPAFGAPVPVLCDYASTAKTARDAKGDEFTTELLLYTEQAGIKQGDRIMLGASTATDPIAAGAKEVRNVLRNADTFDRLRDDFEILT